MLKKIINLFEKEKYLGWFLIFPSMLIIAGLIFYPVLYNFYLSFHEVIIGIEMSYVFVGLSNYIDLLTDSGFWHSVYLTLVFTFSTTLISTIIGFFAALLLNNKFKGRFLVRGIVLFPYAAPVISLVFAWRYIFHPVFGQFNYLLTSVLGVIPEPIAWLEMPRYALIAVIVFNSWRMFPFAFLMLIARLQAIPQDHYDAAKVDGATFWQRLRYIILPQMMFVIATIFLLRGIWNIYKFGEIWLLTRHLNVLSVYAYRTAFSQFNQGMAATITTSMFLMLLGFIILYIKKVLKW